MKVDDHVLHFRVIDGALRIGAPGLFGGSVVGIDTDYVKVAKIGKFEAARVCDPAAHHKVELLHEGTNILLR